MQAAGLVQFAVQLGVLLFHSQSSSLEQRGQNNGHQGDRKEHRKHDTLVDHHGGSSHAGEHGSSQSDRGRGVLSVVLQGAVPHLEVVGVLHVDDLLGAKLRL